MGKHLVLHGDGVKDIAFEVEDLNAIIKVTFVPLYITVEIQKYAASLIFLHTLNLAACLFGLSLGAAVLTNKL